MALLADTIDTTTRFIGKLLAWLVLLMVVVQFAVVVARYVFGIGSLYAQESVVYMHAFLFMLAAAYTLSEDGHVRVDIFYRSASPRFKAWVNLLGSVAFLIPVSAVIVSGSWFYVANSWRIMESSMEVSGIPGVFLLKTAIPVFGILMGAQGVVMALRALAVIFRRPVAELAGAALIVLPLGAVITWLSLDGGWRAAERLMERAASDAATAMSTGETVARIAGDACLVFFPLVGAGLVIAALAYGATAASRLAETRSRA
jgi:TRAP-type mannitol/chloroaromatic compound transport system permease small subunit